MAQGWLVGFYGIWRPQSNELFGSQCEWSLPGMQDDPGPVRSSQAGFFMHDNVGMETKSSTSDGASVASIQSSSMVMAGVSGMARPTKRKRPSLESSQEFGLDADEEGGMETEDSAKKFARQNHSEIEKRRRDKMNTYIIELSNMLPMCGAMNRKLDKLTVLRMAVQHMKSLRGASSSYRETSHKPSFLSDDELKHIILEASDGFLFVVGCDRARILFVSESVKKILHYTRNELIGQSLFDYIHPHDISKVKEQFSSSDLAPRERLIDAKTLMPVKTELPQRPTHLCSGARRSFYCRMKYRSDGSDQSKGVKVEKDDNEFVQRKRKSEPKSYTVIHFTGYLKSWPTSKININSEEDLEDNCSLSCLVAVGQIRTSLGNSSSSNSLIEGPELRPMEYMFRISSDGKFTFIDQAMTVVLGYLPQELLGSSVYEYYHQDDITRMAEIHRKVLESKERIQTGVYRFKGKTGSFLHVRSTCFSFRNPWTKEVEYIVCTNSVVPIEEVTSSGQGFESSAGVLSVDTDGSVTESGNSSTQDKVLVPGLAACTRPGAGRIGRQIALEMLEGSRNSRSPQVVDSTENTGADVYESQVQIPQKHASILPGSSQSNRGLNPTLGRSSSQFNSGPNGVNIPASGSEATLQEQSSLIDSVIEEQALESMSNPTGTDDNDEAAMSMIMSLLEADAGLGGPIDFNDLPWPL